jgi:hypothetical protein
VAKWLAGGNASRSGRTGCCVLVRRDSGFKLGFQKHLSAKDAKNREVKKQYFFFAILRVLYALRVFAGEKKKLKRL